MLEVLSLGMSVELDGMALQVGERDLEKRPRVSGLNYQKINSPWKSAIRRSQLFPCLILSTGFCFIFLCGVGE